MRGAVMNANRRFAVPGMWTLSVLLWSVPRCPATESPAYLHASPQALQWFREAKFGVFFCWGPCSLLAQEIGWSRRGPRPGRPPATRGVPVDVYDNLYKRFNPTRFNAREWVQLVKDAGARYVIFLTKHHDGFCMFDSRYTDYKITNTPFGRDVARELADACHELGIRVVWYYSLPDWHHPDYRTKHHDRYLAYLHHQIRELCTNYGKVDGLWFDGLGGREQDWHSRELFRMVRKLQPGILLNDRAGLPGDFDTPEQRVGTFQLDRMWESCITLSTGWSWRGESAPVKSLKECLHLLIRCAGGGGNLALDSGPMPDGRVDPRQAERYRQMGRWLRKYGESIYGTTGGPYMPAMWGVSTRKGNAVFLHVLDWWGEDTLTLPPLPGRVTNCRALTGGRVLWKQGKTGLELSLPGAWHDDLDTVLKLEWEGTVRNLAPIPSLPAEAVSLDRPATASSQWSKDYAPAKAFDGDDRTRWGAAPGSRSGWVAIDLGKPTTIDRVFIHEDPWNRVRKFQLQSWKEGAWHTFHEGTRLGRFRLKFAPLTTRRIRLLIEKATNVPTIWEMRVFAARRMNGKNR